MTEKLRTRDARRTRTEPAGNDLEPDFHSSWAVVVGIDDYGHGIPPLRTAVNDARRVARILEDEHGYDVELLDSDATRDNIAKLLTQTLASKVGPDDRVFFYFAGHGVALDGDDGPAGGIRPRPYRDCPERPRWSGFATGRLKLVPVAQVADMVANLPQPPQLPGRQAPPSIPTHGQPTDPRSNCCYTGRTHRGRSLLAGGSVHGYPQSYPANRHGRYVGLKDPTQPSDLLLVRCEIQERKEPMI